MNDLIVVAIISLIITFLIGYFVLKLKIPKELIDHPNSRKIHHHPIPMIGGIIIFFSLLIVSIIFKIILNETFIYYFIFYTIFLLIGLFDDIYTWSYKRKFIYEVLAIVSFLYIFQIDLTNIVILNFEIKLPLLINTLIIILWIIGIINAFNFFDGMNGLAGSIAIIIVTGYALLNTHPTIIGTSVAIMIIFSILGFLFYNKPPTKMFLGDSGSMSLGFIVATFPIVYFNYGEPINFSIPMIITSILLMEMFVLIIYRFLKNKNPFHPGKDHLHHLLMNMNIRRRNIVLLICTFFILEVILAYFYQNLSFLPLLIIELMVLVSLICYPREYVNKIIVRD